MLSLADAIIEENLSKVQSILQTGVDPNQLDEYGFTFLIEAALVDNIEIAKMLIHAGADANLQDATGGTPLHWAVENNNVELVQLLLTNRANPNAYTFAGQPVLAMALLRQQTEIKKLLLSNGADLKFAQDFINAKLLGHMYELVGTANIIDPNNQFVEIDFEGFFLESSLAMITDSLRQFENHFSARNLRQFSSLSQNTIAALTRATLLAKYQHYQADIKANSQQINQLLAEEPIIIPVGYEGHAITFVKLGDIIAKCDRREESRLYDNIMYYRMMRPSALTSDFLKNFMFEKKSSHYVNVELHRVLGLEPITELKIEAQISGNCSWANVEATIPTLFFMYYLVSQKDNLSSRKNIALNYFHRWRIWNRERALNFCIQSFKSSDSLRNACKAEILAAILFQCCRHMKPEDNEKTNAILEVLTQPNYEYILKNYIKTYIYESHSKEGKEFKQLLETWGYL